MGVRSIASQRIRFRLDGDTTHEQPQDFAKSPLPSVPGPPISGNTIMPAARILLVRHYGTPAWSWHVHKPPQRALASGAPFRRNEFPPHALVWKVDFQDVMRLSYTTAPWLRIRQFERWYSR